MTEVGLNKETIKRAREPLHGYTITTLTFDCYGLTIDESGIWDGLVKQAVQQNGSSITRDQALEDFARVESALQAGTPDKLVQIFWQRPINSCRTVSAFKISQALDPAFGAFVPLLECLC